MAPPPWRGPRGGAVASPFVLLGRSPPRRGADPSPLVHDGGRGGIEREAARPARRPPSPRDRQGSPAEGPSPVLVRGRPSRAGGDGRDVRTGGTLGDPPSPGLPFAGDGPGAVREPPRPRGLRAVPPDPADPRALVPSEGRAGAGRRPPDCRVRDKPERGEPADARAPRAADRVGAPREPAGERARGLLPRHHRRRRGHGERAPRPLVGGAGPVGPRDPGGVRHRVPRDPPPPVRPREPVPPAVRPEGGFDGALLDDGVRAVRERRGAGPHRAPVRGAGARGPATAIWEGVTRKRKALRQGTG